MRIYHIKPRFLTTTVFYHEHTTPWKYAFMEGRWPFFSLISKESTLLCQMYMVEVGKKLSSHCSVLISFLHFGFWKFFLESVIILNNIFVFFTIDVLTLFCLILFCPILSYSISLLIFQ